MKNSRAGLVALLVVLAATALMVFFVLPRVTGEKQPIGEAVNDATKAVSDAVTETQAEANKRARAVADEVAGAAAKMGRLAADAGAAAGELKALFANKAVPETPILASAKTKAETAIKAVADFELPAGLDATTTGALNLLRDGANKALTILQSLPNEPDAALAAIERMEAALAGKPDPLPAVAETTATDDKAAVTTDTPSATATDDTKKTSEPTAVETASDETIPAFDVLRVEPDGSTVIAGKAEPGGKLDILNGDTVITSVDVGSSGDFAAVLDKPLMAGDYQLVLKVTGKNGKTTLSEEVATISVPQNADGELLAMVSKPGEASRIIAAPVAGQTVTADATAGGTKPAAETGATPDQPVATDTKITMPDLPAGSADLTATAPAVSGGEETALVKPEPEANAPAANPEIKVTAVEIEAAKIFVAGVARPGASLIAYADDRRIGQTSAGSEGHFVIDGTMDLAVGDHTIKVDLVDGSGKVLVRATVPFNRPEGNQVAVVAQTADTVSAASGAALDGSFKKMHGDLRTAFTLLRNLFANARVPGAEELAAARSATEIALKSLADFRSASDAQQTFKDIAAKTSASAAKALTALQALPREAKAVGDALEGIGAMIAETMRFVPDAGGTLNDTAATDANAALSADGTPALAGAEANSGASASGEPLTIEQAPLTESKSGSVIIRRGDTLWQISRRIYGQGVRYTTIYVANQPLIVNPDRIRPGQIFGVPKDALPDAEELHRKRLSGQKL